MDRIEPLRGPRADERVQPVPAVRRRRREDEREEEERGGRREPSRGEGRRPPEGAGPHVDVLA